MKFEVTILGNNSAFPAYGRFPTSQVVNHDDHLFMIDCGEGTQVRLSKFRIKRSRIDHIFISHLHGDHVYGLPGLLNSYAHTGREKPMHIYGPKGIRMLIDTVLRLSASIVSYDIVYTELDHTDRVKVFEGSSLRVYAFPMKHRVPTYGYLFEERKEKVNVSKEAIEFYGLSVDQIRAIKAGSQTLRLDGEEISVESLLTRRPRRSYAFCSDTVYDPGLVKWIKGVDLLYHEATFMHDLEHKAEFSKHTTALQAGMIARLAEVEKLIIGHFSSRYKDVAPLVEEARESFPEVEAAEEGMIFSIG
ncbi:MAG: ribonuclease Z [Bacteroidetes bacterium]|nr:MAG: ribonuclease Z [Bacteroidota bacterium]